MKSNRAVITVSRIAKRLITLSICLAALLLLGQLFGQKQVKESKVVKHYRELAERGRVDIQFRLGELYDPDTPDYSHGADNPRQTKGQPLALAVNKSFTEAAKWYQMAANGGDVAAQARLADISRDGKLSSVDLARPAVPTSVVSAADAVTRRRTPAVAASAVKLLKKKATDVKYFITAVQRAQEWVDAVEANGTPAEKVLANKWLAVHTGAREAGNRCDGCENPPSDSDRRFAESAFYDKQGAEFKAYARRWQKLGAFAEEEETGEHISTTAEVLAGAAADITGAVAQGRAQRAAINQQTAQVKQEQVEAQRRQQLERQQQQAAEAQRLQALAKRMEQDALDKRTREQEAANQDLTKAVWSPAEASFDLRRPFPADFHLITPRGGEVLVLSISIGQVTINQNSTAQGILALDVLNASTCALHLSGMLYSKGTPIKDAGDTNIGPGQRGQFDSEHGRFFANANSPVVFKPTGFLHDCK